MGWSKSKLNIHNLPGLDIIDTQLGMVKAKLADDQVSTIKTTRENARVSAEASWKDQETLNKDNYVAYMGKRDAQNVLPSAGGMKDKARNVGAQLTDQYILNLPAWQAVTKVSNQAAEDFGYDNVTMEMLYSMIKDDDDFRAHAIPIGQAKEQWITERMDIDGTIDLQDYGTWKSNEKTAITKNTDEWENNIGKAYVSMINDNPEGLIEYLNNALQAVNASEQQAIAQLEKLATGGRQNWLLDSEEDFNKDDLIGDSPHSLAGQIRQSAQTIRKDIETRIKGAQGMEKWKVGADERAANQEFIDRANQAKQTEMDKAITNFVVDKWKGQGSSVAAQDDYTRAWNNRVNEANKRVSEEKAGSAPEYQLLLDAFAGQGEVAQERIRYLSDPANSEEWNLFMSRSYIIYIEC